MRPILLVPGLAAILFASKPAFAADAAPPQAEAPAREASQEEPTWARTKSGYFQLFLTAMAGGGLRFNNPYRLATPLGDSAESVSRTATYGDLGVAVSTGNPLGFQHGLAFRWSFALEGVSQSVVTPSYLLYRRWRALAVHGRLGVPIVLSPDTTYGLEAAAGGAVFIRGGIGVVAEVVGDVFWGTGTRDKTYVTYPVLSGQLGLVLAYEVLP